MTAVVALAVCALLGSPQAKSYGKESVRLYIFATETAAGASATATPDEAQQGRVDAVRELKDALRRKAGLSIVEDRAEADVLIEVTDRDQQDAGEGGFGGVKLSPLVNTIIRTHVTAGTEQTDIKGMGPGTGDRAAKDAAERLLRWIVRNRVDHQPRK